MGGEPTSLLPAGLSAARCAGDRCSNNSEVQPAAAEGEREIERANEGALGLRPAKLLSNRTRRPRI